ncbi:Hypothetical_protein [Hexamita inflata]|uniref:Hypothetical_protein n=1 Tax=Hexamita inflata TaxID=28002 RepID=A0AA86QN61_9EUKA|nr:Hypothetical protein HINF_LOCUS44662 [Hexamita inflata]
MQKQFQSQLSKNQNENKKQFPSIRQLEKIETEILQKKLAQQQLQWYGSLIELFEVNTKRKQTFSPEKITYEYAKSRLNKRQQLMQQQFSPLDTINTKSVSQIKTYEKQKYQYQMLTPIQSFSNSNNSQEKHLLKLEPIIQFKK